VTALRLQWFPAQDGLRRVGTISYQSLKSRKPNVREVHSEPGDRRSHQAGFEKDNGIEGEQKIG